MSVALNSDRYEILSRIASGGMATVFVGRARGAIGFSRLVALKVPHPFVAHDKALRDSLEREARLASAIHHPHVVSVLDVEVHGEEVVLVLDYVEGCSLAKLVSHASLSVGAAVRVILDVASGLHAAHASCDRAGQLLGVVHRDVSPQNVLVGLDGYARLTDFGIAKSGAERDQSAPDVIKGKLGYMAPEYIAERRFDARSDQYALAVVAWEAIANARMFAASSEGETLRRILDGTTPKLTTVNEAFAPIDEVISRALARDPAKRFESVAAFATALEELARERGWVATHEDVGLVVDATAGEQLRERRRTIEAFPATKPAPSSARDEMSTVSLEDARPEPKRRSFGLIAAAGVALVVVVASVVGFVASSHARAPASVATEPSSAPEESAAPPAASTEAIATTAAAPAASQASPAPSTTVAPRGHTSAPVRRKRGVLFRDPG